MAGPSPTDGSVIVCKKLGAGRKDQAYPTLPNGSGPRPVIANFKVRVERKLT